MFEEKERPHADMAKKAGGKWGYVNQSSEKLSEKQKIIQEQGNLIKEKEKESSTDGPSYWLGSVSADRKRHP